jgi:hypothetical protein
VTRPSAGMVLYHREPETGLAVRRIAALTAVVRPKRPTPDVRPRFSDLMAPRAQVRPATPLPTIHAGSQSFYFARSSGNGSAML